MDLKSYFSETGTDLAAFAETIGVTAASVYRYMGRDRIPQADVMERIAAATAGKVRAADFFPDVESVADRAMAAAQLGSAPTQTVTV